MSKPSSLAKYAHDPISEKEIDRFHQLEMRYQTNPAVEGQLRKLAEGLRARLLPAFRAWVSGSSSKGQGHYDGALIEIGALLEKAVTTEELVMAVDQTIHAQHQRGIFIGEMVVLKDEEHMKSIGIDPSKFRDPDRIEWKPVKRWRDEGIAVGA